VLLPIVGNKCQWLSINFVLRCTKLSDSYFRSREYEFSPGLWFMTLEGEVLYLTPQASLGKGSRTILWDPLTYARVCLCHLHMVHEVGGHTS
jgi:hypothetical protein